MKVGYLCSDVDIPLYGHEGCSVHIRELTDALVEAGHDVFIVTSWLGEASGATVKARVNELRPRGLDASGWELVEREPVIRNAQLERDLRSVAYNFWFQAEGSSIIRREQPDLLYERYALFGWAGVELRRRYGIPLILEVNAPLCEEQAGYEKFPLSRTAEQMETKILRGADALVVVSRWLRDWAVARGVDQARVHVVPNGAAERLCGEEAGGEGIRERYGLGQQRVIGYVGSFQRWHDLEGLLEAFHRLHRSDPDLRLLLVGDGPGREPLEQAVNRLGLGPAVIFTGNVPHRLVPDYIGAMDVAVAPYGKRSDFYFSPIKLFEYLAAGRPTVAASLGQIEEVVEHGRTGWLYPPGDGNGLVEGLAAALYRPGFGAALGRAGRRKVLSEHTWQAVAARIASVAEPLLRSRGKAHG